MNKDTYEFQCSRCGGQKLNSFTEIADFAPVEQILKHHGSADFDVVNGECWSHDIEVSYTCANCAKRWDTIEDMLEDRSLTES